MARGKDRHCSYCGHPFAPDASWPRRCGQCANLSYRNPLPVSVVLLPTDDGLLAVRRAHAPGRGQLALPGGFIELPESWQEAGVRELYEETGVEVAPETLVSYRVYSAPDGTLLIFGLAPPQKMETLPPFTPTEESSERVILTGPTELAFSLHTRVVQEYFAHSGVRSRSWVAWGRQLQAVAQSGLTYAEGGFDRERYQTIRSIAAEMMAAPAGVEPEYLADLFAEEMGYATPKVGVRAATFRQQEGRPEILLVKERDDGLWTLPGGWVDIDESPAGAVIRETIEEAGLRVQPRRLVAVYDPQKHGMKPPRPFALIRLFFLCTIVSGSPTPGIEAEAVGFFRADALPPLSHRRVTEAQIERMFDFYHDPSLPPDFD